MLFYPRDVDLWVRARTCTIHNPDPPNVTYDDHVVCSEHDDLVWCRSDYSDCHVLSEGAAPGSTFDSG
jgi:hypothetical protein